MKRSLLLTLLALTSTSAFAADQFNAAQKTEIENVIHAYLKKKPEVILEAVQELQKKQTEQTQKVIENTHESATQFAEQLFRSKSDPILGNATGKITVVEFFDYQCGHCITMDPVLADLVKTNKDVRLVLKELPIRGPGSVVASRAALAAHKQGKYEALHKELFALNQPINEDLVYKAAQKVGLDLTKLKKDMEDPAITASLEANDKLARDLKLIGTPAVFIAKTDIKNNAKSDQIVYMAGRSDKSDLESAIKKIS